MAYVLNKCIKLYTTLSAKIKRREKVINLITQNKITN